MKFLCTVLYVLIVVAVIGSASSDKAAGGEHGTQTPAGGKHGTKTSAGGEGENHTSAGGDHACEVELVGDFVQEDMPNLLLFRLYRCFGHHSPALREGLRSANTTQDFRNSFKGYCDHVPTIAACSANVDTQSEHCLNATMSRSFKTITSDFDTALRVMCEQDGVKVATIVEELKHHENRSEIQVSVEKCAQDTDRFTRDIDGNNATAVSVAYYNTFVSAKECIADAAPASTALNHLVDDWFGGVLKKLKCIHPDTQAEVLCQTFVNNN